MKITKYVHSCVLVETEGPAARTVLFDPGSMSVGAVPVESLPHLDNIVITHGHGDHFHLPLVQQLVAAFPDVKITMTPEVVSQLQAAGITASTEGADPLVLFAAPHESVAPLFEQPQATGVHLAGMFTHPGDCHSFAETMPVLALPVTAPWGSLIAASRLALSLKPRYILPTHDWHWNDQARASAYDMLESFFAEHDITFLKPETGKSIALTLS